MTNIPESLKVPTKMNPLNDTAFSCDPGFLNSVNSGHYEEDGVVEWIGGRGFGQRVVVEFPPALQVALDAFQGHETFKNDAFQLTENASPTIRDDRTNPYENDLGNHTPTLEFFEPTSMPPSDDLPVEEAYSERAPIRRKRQRGGRPTSPACHLPQPVARGGIDYSYVELVDADEEPYEEGQTVPMAKRRIVSQIRRQARVQFDETYTSSRYKGDTKEINSQLHWKDPINNIWRRFASILALASLLGALVLNFLCLGPCVYHADIREQLLQSHSGYYGTSQCVIP